MSLLRCTRCKHPVASGSDPSLSCPRCGGKLAADRKSAATRTSSGHQEAEIDIRSLMYGAAVKDLAAIPGAIGFSCERCRQTGRSLAANMGRTVVCPNCSRTTTVQPIAKAAKVHTQVRAEQAAPAVPAPHQRPQVVAVGGAHDTSEPIVLDDPDLPDMPLGGDVDLLTVDDERGLELPLFGEESDDPEGLEAGSADISFDLDLETDQAELAAQQEQERRAAEEREQARKAAEEEAIRLEDQQQAEETRRQAELVAQQEQERRAAEEQEQARKAAEEEAVRLEEQRQAEETRRQAELVAQQEQERRAAEEREKGRKAEEEATRLEQQKKAEEAQRQAELVAQQEQERRAAEEREKARKAAEEEATRLEQQKKAEEARRQAELVAQQEQERRAAEEREKARKAAEEEATRLEQQQKAEEARRQAELVAQQEQERRAAEEREKARQAEEQARRAAQQKAEAERQAQEAKKHAQREETERQKRTEPPQAVRPDMAVPVPTPVASAAAPPQTVRPAAPLPAPPQPVRPAAPSSPTITLPELDAAWSDRLAAVQQGKVSKNRLGMPPARLFALPLNGQVFGQEINADIYVVNPFRYLAVSGSASRAEIDQANSRLKAIGKLRPEAAKASFIQTGYDGHLQLGDPFSYIEEVNNPRQRFLYEVFWPHFDDGSLSFVRQHHRLHSRPTLEHLTKAAEGADGRVRMLARHALAIWYQNLAIACELAYATGQADTAPTMWKRSLQLWHEVLSDEQFWTFLHERVATADHPALLPTDVEQLRAHLPGLLLGFNRLFALAYVRAGDVASCQRHLRLIADSSFDNAVRRSALIEAVQGVTTSRLEPLIRWAQDPTNYRDGEYVGGGQEKQKYTRAEFQKLYDPILGKALELCEFLSRDLKLDATLVQLTQFDDLCEILLAGVNKHIDYDNDDRLRSILYSILMARRLLKLPISESQRRKLEKNIVDDTKILYKDFGEQAQVDPSHCYFLGSEEADPDCSLQLPIYKITKVTGTNIEWSMRKVLIPRSKLAQQVHSGAITKAQLAALRDDESTRQLRQQVGTLTNERTTRTKAITDGRDKSLAKLQADRDAELAVYNQCVAKQEQGLQAAVKKSEAGLQQQIAAATNRTTQSAQQLQQSLEPGVKQAEANYRAAAKTAAGWDDFPRFELPYLGGALLLTGLIAIGLAIAGNLATTVGLGILATLAAIAGGGALGIGRSLRKTAAAKVRSIWQAASADRDARVSAVRAAGNQEIEALRQAAQRASEPTRRELTAIQQKRNEIGAKHEAKMKAVRDQSAAQVRDVETPLNDKIRSLEQQIESRINVKPESDRFNHPAYKGAKSNGFQDGERPSESETDRLMKREMDNFLDSLTQLDRVLLAQMAKVLSTDQFSQLLGTLMGMSSYERRQKLDEIMRIFLRSN